MPDRERLDLSHGSPHILDHDLPFQWYFDGNAQQDARTQQYRTTQIYGKITDHKIQEDMTALTDREHTAFEGYCESIARQSILQQQE